MMRFLKSIRVQLIVIMLTCYLTPILILGLYMGNVFFTDLRTRTETALTTSVEHAYTMSLQNVERAIELAKDATYDGELTDVYAGYRAGNITDAEFLRLCRNYIERKYSREGLFTFALFFPVEEKDMLVYDRTGYEPTMAFLRDARERVLEVGETLDTRCLFLEEGGQVYLVRNLLNLKLERYGMLVLGVDMEQMLAEVRGLARTWDGETQVMLGTSGAADMNWDELSPGLQDTRGKEGLICCQRTRSADYDFALALSVPSGRIYGEIHAFHRLMAVLLVALVPVLALILWYVHRRIVKPISLLSQASMRIEAGELGVTVPMHGDDELGRLGCAFSNMSRRIAALIDRTYKEEIALRDAKIQAMQSRINPHFINNALETLNWQARMEGSDTMSGMVESLSVLLNASMARADRRMVPLQEEIDVAKAYCYFMGLRYGERLQVRYDLDPKAMGAVVPLLTLQPLLENAVEHGIEPAGGGEIELSSLRAGDALMLRVVNSGRPLREEDQERIARALQGDSDGGVHLGLANIAMRLRLIYGGRARLTVESDGQERTVVCLELPLKEAEA